MYLITVSVLFVLVYNCLAIPLGTCKDLLIETQNIGDSEQCDLYYECQPSGAVVKKLCDDGYVFHLHAARCVINVNVDCGNRTVLQPPVAPTKECPRLNGFFPHPDNTVCNKFYQCVKGKGDLKTCPATLVFDLQFGICLYPDQVNRTGCTANDLIQAKCPKYDGKTPLQFGDHERFPAPDGHCRNFIICLEDGAVRKGSCPYGKVYNTKIASCDDQENVPRCSTYYPTTTTKRPTPTTKYSLRNRINKRPPFFRKRPQSFRNRPQQQPEEPEQEKTTQEKVKPTRRQRPFRNRFRNRPQHQGFRRGPQFRPEQPEEEEQPEAPVEVTEKPTRKPRPSFRRRPGGRPGLFNRRRTFGKTETSNEGVKTTTTTTTTISPLFTIATTRKSVLNKDEQSRARARLRSLFSGRRQRLPTRRKSTTTTTTTVAPEEEHIPAVAIES